MSVFFSISEALVLNMQPMKFDIVSIWSLFEEKWVKINGFEIKASHKVK
jgi:hypothetical protein